MSRSDYECDTKTQRAVERKPRIVGDAVRKLSLAFEERYPGIERDEIYAARNVVVHQYFGVDNAVVWDILEEDLPRLGAVVNAALAAGDSGNENR